MNSCDKQTKWLIAIILVGSALIIGGFIGAYDAIDNTKQKLEDRKNEATLQINESQGHSADSARDLYGGVLQRAVAEQQAWPNVDSQHHCLLVNVPPPLAYPDELSTDNTIRLPAELCWSLIQSIKRLVELDMLDPSELRFP